MSKDEYDVEYYKIINNGESDQANCLAAILMEIYHPSSVIDLGGATGLYLAPFYENGIDVLSVDLSEAIKEVNLIPNDSILIHNLCEAFDTKRKWDICLCIETLEHIQKECEMQAIKNICSQSNNIVFSAAHPKQGGRGHVNEQPKSHWIKKFEELNYSVNEDKTERILLYLKENSTSLKSWLVDNLVMFEK